MTANFDRVVAVESAPAAIPALETNLAAHIREPQCAPDSLEFLRDNRQSAQASHWPDLIVVDPPRTGLGAEIAALLAEIAAPAMVYVSCDPAIAGPRSARASGSGYTIESFTLADLFPQTFHIETVVRLRRA